MRRTYNPPTVPLEDAEQRVIFQWAAMETAARPELGLLYAIPNGGKRAIKTAVALKKQGVKRGVPDMCLPVPRGGFNGLYIELKRVKGGTVSDEQREWIAALAEQGYKAVVCRGAEEAIGTIKEYLKWT
ncbi:MAG: VRR-NUC domain-containing protein [Eubacteriales bacterium]|nr:VRR-NUC domain-containing protein [Eubacteriales bacterium]